MTNPFTKQTVLIFSMLAICSVGCSAIPLKSPLSGKTSTALGDSTLPPKDAAKVCVSTAKQLHQRGEFAQAAAMLERGRTLAPKGYDYSRHLAALYSNLEIAEKAEAEYQLALSASPQDADLWNDYGYFQYRQNQFAAAEKSFRQALSIDPQHEKASMNLSVALVSMDRLPEAYERFEKIVGPAAAHQNIGVLLAKQGRTTEAETAFNHAIRLEPNTKIAHAFLNSLEKQKLDAARAQQRLATSEDGMAVYR
ncbi:tetratricopeptide repeat protein [Blastopirellula retiformator]|uniref:Lipoprotein NlpI n=1 Tax=Blastopirellula retiformator TaxID=2527970 RepID=A0A5C5V8L1_9BACT|nr:tetratricopeptide repeat protein [Blastopirellula retiformator]TWT34621.1 lipoprotein NlpI [Blastopirellula retiformator]